ncbi:hypothetical protein MSAN_01963500 [Mycena sanguinolenta]|uniref:Hydrophobin n=1 Tax=Mycena sanguinolenta TaxID=230812 RepID=A0A8H6XM83_9AGAR|nr:hypothetical protein MSAN_01963500 [Mycena sanguinolenta]
MHARIFNFLSLLGILAIIFALISPSVIAAPAAESDLEESAYKPGLKISGLLMPSLDNRQVGDDCGPVTGANIGGTCFNANTQCCTGFYSIGFCPGPSNIRCCTPAQRCSDGSGFCNDLNHVSCSVPYVANLCPGPSNVRCCRGVAGANFCTPGGP